MIAQLVVWLYTRVCLFQNNQLQNIAADLSK